MKIIITIAALSIVAIGGFLLLSSPEENSVSEDQSSQEVNIETIKTDVSNGALLIDVRTEEEYQAGYIEGADLFTLARLQNGETPDVPKDNKIYVYCRSGNRSAEAASLLKSAGYLDVVDLGGINDVITIGGVQVK